MSTSSKRAELRLSQVITTFGPGAMVDLPSRSVIIGGLERWDMRGGHWKAINEPRATHLLQERLSENGGPLTPGTVLQLRTPPLDPQLPGREPPGIAATIFPCWFVVNEEEQLQHGRRRRLVHWRHLDPGGGRQKFILDTGKKADVTPVRFVAACKKGHIQDIDWQWAVHGVERCTEPLWLEEAGATGDPRSIRIACGCGKHITLENAQAPNRLGTCLGKQPWLEQDSAQGCDQQLRFLTRTATNAYFPQVLTVISLPSAEDALTQLVQDHWTQLQQIETIADLPAARKFNDKIAAAFKGVGDSDLFDRIVRFRNALLQKLEKKPKHAEFELLASGLSLIGENRPDAELHANTLARSDWGGVRLLPGIESVVAIHRLREVSCLYGFTRFEAAPTAIDGDIEEINISVDGAALTSRARVAPGN